MVTIGQTVSHYRILEKLGGGGMGVVYRARDERLSRDVALKVLPAGLLADEAARSRFRREALTLSQLNHPNIAVVHDFDSDQGVDFIAIEYVAGETLAAKVAGGPLPEKEVIALGTQIAEALEEAQEQDIIHRDLKPANVMVTPKGRVKVLDFGLAKLVKPAEVAAATASLGETQAGTIMGTVPYMAPEQLQGQAVDARADLYALGAVLYEMATGRRPFPETQTTPLIAAILTQTPPPPRELNGQISPGLEAIIRRALEKSPDERYQSAKEILEDLGRVSAPGSVVGAQRPVMTTRWALAAVAATAAIVALAILVGMNTGGLRDRLLHRAAGPPRIESIAVLPLDNLSHDPEQEYFADGMTEELITDLSKIGALRVISRTSVMHYKGTQKTVPEIARELHVDALVEGSVARSGNRVRITAQLIHAPSDTHLWADNFERDSKDVLALQDEVARDIANEIQVKLTPQEQARLTSARPVNPEAHELYLKGRYYWNKRTPEALKKSLEYFQQAVEKDPGYALGYAGLADAYAMLGASMYAVLPPKQAYPKAEAAARKALEFDSTLAEPHTALGWSKFVFDWDWQGAEREYRQAIDFNPNYANAHHWYASYLTSMRRYPEAIAEDRKAESLDPLSLVISVDVAMEALRPAGMYDQAMEQCRRTLEMDPNFALAHACLSESYADKRMYKEAIAEMQKAVELSGASPPSLAGLGATYAMAGRRDEAMKVLSELKVRSKREFVSSGDFVMIYTALGDKDQAFAWLEKAYEERSDPILVLSADPDFSSLRSDPRYQDLLRRVGLPP